jgi:hypothetical protein
VGSTQSSLAAATQDWASYTFRASVLNGFGSHILIDSSVYAWALDSQASKQTTAAFEAWIRAVKGEAPPSKTGEAGEGLDETSLQAAREAIRTGFQEGFAPLRDLLARVGETMRSVSATVDRLQRTVPLLSRTLSQAALEQLRQVVREEARKEIERALNPTFINDVTKGLEDFKRLLDTYNSYDDELRMLKRSVAALEKIVVGKPEGSGAGSSG